MEFSDRRSDTTEPSESLLQARQDYLESIQRRRYSPRTVAAYAYEIKIFLIFVAGLGRTRVQDITQEDIEKYRVALFARKMTPHSLDHYLRTVRHLFRHQEKTNRIFVNPTQHLILGRHPYKLLPVPTEKDIRKLLAAPDSSTPIGIRDRALLETAYSTGSRLEEMTRMKIYDPNFDQGLIRVMGKGSQERLVPLGKQAIFWLRRYIDEARPKLLKDRIDVNALWIDKHRKTMSYQILGRTVCHYGKVAGIGLSITPHALRRACATHMLEHGAHPVQIQMLLGHATLQHLGHYLRLTVKDLRKTHARSKPGR